MVNVLGQLLAAVVRLDALVVALVFELRHPLSTKVMTSVTGLGSATAALVFVGVCYTAGWRREFRTALVALAIAGAVVGFLMFTVQRPFPPQPVCVTDGAAIARSFPSGHAAAVAVFTAIARRSDELPFGPVAVLAVAVAVSRIYLGTHYFSDTVVGVVVGLASVLLAVRLLARFDASRPSHE
jgi:undecaprenyl-diphosphatase